MNKKLNPTTNTIVLPVLTGIILAVLVTVLGSAISTTMISKGMMRYEVSSIIVFLIMIISSAAGSLVSRKLDKNGSIINVLITTGLYILLLLAAKIILFDAPFEGLGKGIIAIILGTLPSVLLPFRFNNGKQRKFKYTPK